MTEDVTRLENAAVPSETMCPYCGSPPDEESQVTHKLSNLGYLHDDQDLKCSNEHCNRKWTCGVPVGSDDEFADELFCKSCSKRFGRIHRGEPKDEDTMCFHMKCPNCFYFWKIYRRVVDGCALVGYPDITGYRGTARNTDYKVEE